MNTEQIERHAHRIGYTLCKRCGEPLEAHTVTELLMVEGGEVMLSVYTVWVCQKCGWQKRVIFEKVIDTS
jgi:RNase P subunit RPR2